MTAAPRLRFTPFPYRKNSLNLFRLILAAMVLFAHSWYIAGKGIGPQLEGQNLGGWAVSGFFVISGFLITGSRLTHTAGEFLVHRIARIFPAFLVCLVVTALVFGPIAELIQNHSMAGYFSRQPTPLGFVWSNIGLKINDYNIGDTLQTVPYKSAWNGSMWTLYYEFFCYVIIWALGSILVVRRLLIPVLVVWALSVINWAGLDFVMRFGLNEDYVLLSELLPYFLGGSVAYYVVRRYGISSILGVASLIVSIALIALLPSWGGQLASPTFAYGLLWLSTAIRQPGLITRNDVSYGFYIYAWPIQQLIALLGGYHVGMWFFWLTSVVGTLILAFASWVLVERPALNAARGNTKTTKQGEVKAASAAPDAQSDASSENSVRSAAESTGQKDP